MRTELAGPWAGPGRAGLNFLGSRVERAENYPKFSGEINSFYVKKSKFIVNLSKNLFFIKKIF